MTRYARSGNTQQHKKMPGTATPWSEFSKQKSKSKVQNHKNGRNNPAVKRGKKFQKAKFHNIKNINQASLTQTLSHEETNKVEKFLPLNVFERKKDKLAKHVSKLVNDDSSNLNASKNENYKKKKTHKEKCQKKESYNCGGNLLIQQESKLQERILPNNSASIEFKNIIKEESGHTVSKQENHTNVSIATAIQKKIYEKKKIYMEKFEKNEVKKNLSLPYSKKNKFSQQNNQDTKESPNFNEISSDNGKTFFKNIALSKACFNCRQTGHRYADCPENKNSEGSRKETGVCFKCGLKGHTSYKCPTKIQGFPLAKCFVCKEQGHISKDCPSNKHGLYPKGGGCYTCGNVNHFKKDCPSLKIRKKGEESITVHTINDATSIDHEIVEKADMRKEKKFKKPKVVKF